MSVAWLGGSLLRMASPLQVTGTGNVSPALHWMPGSSAAVNGWCTSNMQPGTGRLSIAAWEQGAEEGDLAPALSEMLGVYVGLKGEVVPENVKKWNLLKVCRDGCCQCTRVRPRLGVVPSGRKHMPGTWSNGNVQGTCCRHACMAAAPHDARCLSSCHLLLCQGVPGMHASRPGLEPRISTQVEVPKDNRHRDRPIVQDIYAALDAHLAAHQSRLSY